MNLDELKSKVSDTCDITKAEAGDAVAAVFGAIQDGLVKGEKISLVGFGSFDVAERKARTGRNPRTGEQISISASKQPRFKAGKGLKDAVNG